MLDHFASAILGVCNVQIFNFFVMSATQIYQVEMIEEKRLDSKERSS